jgi:hypothetical protein
VLGSSGLNEPLQACGGYKDVPEGPFYLVDTITLLRLVIMNNSLTPMPLAHSKQKRQGSPGP